MLNKILITIILIFSNYNSICQTRKIQIISEENFFPIESVEVYDGNNLIGKTNSNGIIEFNFSKLKYIYLIKDGYEDRYLNTKQIESIISLSINKPIMLKEVIVRNLKDNEILDSIEFSLAKTKYLIPNCFKMSNILKTKKDTLHYVNSLFKYDTLKGFQIQANSRIIKNFTSSINNTNNNEVLTYNVNKKNIEFWEYLTVSYIKINGQLEFIKILKNRNKYDFNIISDSIYYKINFESRKKGSLSFNGSIVVDKIDYGIHEFKLNLSDTKNNNIKLFTSKNKAKQSFDILEIDYFIKYLKDENENYNLIYSYLNQSFIQTEGDFKNEIFNKTSLVESSFNFNNVKFLTFDIFNYNIK